MAAAEALRTVDERDTLADLLAGAQVESRDVDRAKRLGVLPLLRGTTIWPPWRWSRVPPVSTMPQ